MPNQEEMVGTAHRDVGDRTAPSWWLGRSPDPTAARLPAGSRLDGDVRCDVVIVGGGFTGLWSAIRLAEADPGCAVVVLERECVGFGASGRNGGFAMTMVGRSLHDLVRKVGPGPALRVHRAMVQTLDEIEGFCRAEAIAADLSRPGLLTVSNGPEQDVRIRQDLEAAERLGLNDLRGVSAAGCRELLAAQGMRCGHVEDAALLVDPAALVRGLAAAARRRGVRVLERTPVEEVRVGPGGVRALTRFGSVRADRGLIATNAYAHAIPRLRRFLFTVCASITLTEPLTAAQWAQVGWERRMGVEDRRVMPHFHRPTPDGRILWGGRDAPHSPIGPDPRRDRDPRILRRLEETFRQTFPQLADVRLTHGWGGPVAATVSCLPRAGWLRGGRLAYALGYSGHGVGPSALMGRVVADLLLGRATERLELPLVTRRAVPLPPEPLRGAILGMAQRALQAADDHGGARGPVGRLAVRLLR